MSRVMICAIVAAWFALHAAAASASSLVTIGSPPDTTPQNHQNEPALAVNAAQPNILAAGVNDVIDLRPCPQVDASQGGTCFDFADFGVGLFGVYFSFERGHSWVQPTYAGLTARDCASMGPCRAHKRSSCARDRRDGCPAGRPADRTSQPILRTEDWR